MNSSEQKQKERKKEKKEVVYPENFNSERKKKEEKKRKLENVCIREEERNFGISLSMPKERQRAGFFI